MDLIKVKDGVYYVTIARNTIVRLGLLSLMFVGFGAAIGVTLTVTSEMRDVIESGEHNKAMIRGASAMTIENLKEIEDLKQRCLR